MDELQQRFSTKQAEYERLMTETLQSSNTFNLRHKMDKLRTLNAELTSIVNELLTALARTQTDASGRLKTVQDELLVKLATLQQDAAGLDKDTLETLRRIRAFEESQISKQVYLYVGIFLMACFILFLVMYVKGSAPQKIDTSSVISPSPAINPTLM